MRGIGHNRGISPEPESMKSAFQCIRGSGNMPLMLPILDRSAFADQIQAHR